MPPPSLIDAPRTGAPTGVVLALGTTQTIAWASSTYLPAILAAPIARELGISSATVFGAFSVSLLVMAVAGPPVGRAIDRLGGRGMLMLSNLVLAAGLGLLGAANGPAMLFGAWCVLGAGMAMGLYDAAFAALVRIYGPVSRKPITGITLIAGFASTVGWPLTAYVDAQVGWRAACYTWALLHLLVALPLNWRYMPAITAAPARIAPATAAQASDKATPQAGDDGQPAAPRRNFVLLAIFAATTAFVTSAFAAHLPGLLLAMGAGTAGALFASALLGPAQVAARLAEFGVMSRYRLHPLVTARVATAMHPVAALMLGIAGGPPALAAAFALLHGAGNGMITIAKGTLPLAMFGSAGYGERQGLLAVAARLMQAAAPYAFGLVLDTFGGRAALALSGGLSLVALVTLVMLRPAANQEMPNR